MAVVGCILLSHSSASAGDAQAGKERAVVCAACHGVDGISIIPMYPNLAGQKELYLIDALKAYRSGMRKHMLMTPQAAALSDKDIENLAAYYTSLGNKPVE
ncbi:c-type cytochrome [Alteromonas oceanisediminis]|uniref:c-type cytochrome n=1 Tax=Alteromonas oceanisediminis TaxID=2836180 RepID=UPI001BD9C7D6|nr:cytochrome c [Alteromonas oceanisediminis]MBT0586835.1 cytochrome c [Alteromonas oceanisediminis]